MPTSQNKLQVTWIAPVVPSLPPLAWLNELNNMQRIPGIELTILTGDSVTVSDVAAILAQPCDILVLSGHGGPGELKLPDAANGEEITIKTRWLAARVKYGCRPRVAILGACGSQLHGDDLRSLTEAICFGGITAIGFPIEANDLAAGKFTLDFISTLALHSTIKEAFDTAIEGISETKTAKGIFLTPGLQDQPFDMEETLQRIEANQSRILQVLSANQPESASQLAAPPPAADNQDSLAHISATRTRSSTSKSPSAGRVHRIRGVTDDE